MNDSVIFEKIKALDLDPILFNLVEKDDGPQWSIGQAQDAEKWYRRFLFLIAKYPGEVIVPTKEIDEIWHTHILDTRKYADDCDFLFGEPLHHFPYLGSRGVDDKELLEKTFIKSLALFETNFNEVPKKLSHNNSSAVCGGGGGARISPCSSSCERNSSRVDMESRPKLFFQNPKVFKPAKQLCT